MARVAIVFLTTLTCIFGSHGVRGADILYDTMNQPVDRDGNFSDGYWLAISFRTGDRSDTLDSLSILMRNPNFLTSGTIRFSLFDTTGENGLPGSAIDQPLGSVSIDTIPTNAYGEVKLTGLNRAVDSDKQYWLVVISTGVSGPFYVGATKSTAGQTTGSLGYSMSVNLGVDWNPAATDFYAIGRIVAVPEPTSMMTGGLACALTISILAIRKQRARA